MCRINLKVVAFLFSVLVSLSIYLFFKPLPVNAQNCQCANWECHEECSPIEPYGCTQFCGCEEVVGCIGTCGPGNYVCNTEGGCCSEEGGGGGATCVGCYLDENGKGMYSVISSSVTQVSPTSAKVTWKAGEFNCTAKRGGVKVIVGRNQEAVNAYCGWAGEFFEGTPTNNPDKDLDGSKGGSGTGGNGRTLINQETAGIHGTGSGGGAGSGNSGRTRGDGGSGIVIVRYPTGSITASGGIVTSAGGDTIHTFTSNSTFSITSGSINSAKLLVVGGGAAGGKGLGGGGAGGGVIYQDNVSLSVGDYPVTVGEGGVGTPMTALAIDTGNDGIWECVTSGTGRGDKGEDSIFGSYTANGGGGGGSNFTVCDGPAGHRCCKTSSPRGGNGGSGGGAAGSGDNSGGIGNASQGNNGGNSSNNGGAGGGGAGSVGEDGRVLEEGGNGGSGFTTDISGVSQTYGAGGGGQSRKFMSAGCYKILPSTIGSRSEIVTGLAPNTTYYFKVVPTYTDDNGTIFCDTTDASSNLACFATINSPLNSLTVGQTMEITTTIGGTSSPATVRYTQTGDPPFFSFTPSETADATSLYQTTLEALRQTTGSSVTSQVYLDSGPDISCSGTKTFVVGSEFNPWWQTQDSDVQANGVLQSSVPSTNYFGLPGAGGFPGVSAHKDGTNGTITTANASETYGWLAQSEWLNPKVFGYDLFVSLIPSDEIAIKSVVSEADLTGAAPDADGFEWYKYDGVANGGIPLTISQQINLGSRKAILLVDSANLNIGASINGIAKGEGFFMTIVKGDITVDKSVAGAPALEGIYVADGSFSTTNTPGAEDDTQLHIRGSVAAYGGVNLDRNLGGAANASPAELFEYAPDLIRLYPTTLSYRRLNWKEVAP